MDVQVGAKHNENTFWQIFTEGYIEQFAKAKQGRDDIYRGLWMGLHVKTYSDGFGYKADKSWGIIADVPGRKNAVDSLEEVLKIQKKTPFDSALPKFIEFIVNGDEKGTIKFVEDPSVYEVRYGDPKKIARWWGVPKAKNILRGVGDLSSRTTLGRSAGGRPYND